MVSTNYYPQFPKKRKYTCVETCEHVATVSDSSMPFIETSSSESPTTSNDMYLFEPSPNYASPFKKRKFSVQSETTVTNDYVLILKQTFWRPWDDTQPTFEREDGEINKKLRLNSEHSESLPETKLLLDCQLCTQKFTRRDNLTRHLKSKHNLKDRPECQFCLKTLSRKDAVLRHELNCHLNFKKRNEAQWCNDFCQNPELYEIDVQF